MNRVQLKMQDKLGIYTSFITAIAIAIICGSVYLQLPQSAAGAFTRGSPSQRSSCSTRLLNSLSAGGVIFIAILFNAFQAFNELPTQMMGRPIMWKHQGFTFYRPSALTLASTCADAPFSFLQLMLFCVIVYFVSLFLPLDKLRADFLRLDRWQGSPREQERSSRSTPSFAPGSLRSLRFLGCSARSVSWWSKRSRHSVADALLTGSSYDVAARLASVLITGCVSLALCRLASTANGSAE